MGTKIATNKNATAQSFLWLIMIRRKEKGERKQEKEVSDITTTKKISKVERDIMSAKGSSCAHHFPSFP
jgi:hypothetical protein